MEVIIVLLLFVGLPILFIVGAVSSKEQNIIRVLRKTYRKEKILKVNIYEMDQIMRDIKTCNQRYIHNREIDKMLKDHRKIFNRLRVYNHYLLPESIYVFYKNTWRDCDLFIHVPQYHLTIDLSDDMDGEEVAKEKEDVMDILVEKPSSDNQKFDYETEVIEEDSSDEEEEMDYIDEYEMYDAIMDDGDDEWY